MELDYHTLDVFTPDRFSGNPLAVVHGADALSGAQMQTIAREFNLSETVFVLAADNPAHTAKIRIFTPAAELPFAGHPTVGTAILLADVKGKLSGGQQDAIVVLEEQIGLVRIGIRRRAGQADYGEFDVPKLPERLSFAPDADAIASALALSASEIGFENHRPSGYSAGVPYIFVPVANLEAISRPRIMSAYWEAAFAGPDGQIADPYIYCRQTVRHDAHFHARMFAPTHGIAEDPATGSAAASFAGVIHEFDQPTNGTHRYLIEQGFEMGRASNISLEVEIANGAMHAARIGGHAVVVMSGRICV